MNNKELEVGSLVRYSLSPQSVGVVTNIHADAEFRNMVNYVVRWFNKGAGPWPLAPKYWSWDLEAYEQ